MKPRFALVLPWLAMLPGLSCSNAARADDDLPGKALYLQHCAQCHQKHGGGMLIIFPALNGSQKLLTQTDDAIKLILQGGGRGMPSFYKKMDDQQLTDVFNYIRTAWDNKGSTISMQDVARVRATLPVPE